MLLQVLPAKAVAPEKLQQGFRHEGIPNESQPARLEQGELE
jgi:hypothetical protein